MVSNHEWPMWLHYQYLLLTLHDYTQDSIKSLVWRPSIATIIGASLSEPHIDRKIMFVRTPHHRSYTIHCVHAKIFRAILATCWNVCNIQWHCARLLVCSIHSHVRSLCASIVKWDQSVSSTSDQSNSRVETSQKMGEKERDRLFLLYFSSFGGY